MGYVLKGAIYKTWANRFFMELNCTGKSKKNIYSKLQEEKL